MRFNWSELSRVERLAVVGGVLAASSAVLPWYSFAGVGVSGLGSGLLALLGILATLAAAFALVSPRIMDSPPTVSRWEPPQLALILAGAGLVLIVLRLLTWISFVSIGLFAGLAGAGIVTYASLGAVRAAGLDIPLDSSAGNDDDDNREEPV